jgi:hypothetical protein
LPLFDPSSLAPVAIRPVASRTKTGKKQEDKMADKMVTGLFRDRESAERAYEYFGARGYTADDVDVLMSDDTRRKYYGDTKDKKVVQTELGTKALEGAGVGAGVGAVAGGALAALAAAATILIPGVGLVVAGPIAAALAGAGAGGVTGGIIGGLIGYGIPEERAKLYESGLKEGGIVLGVKPRTDEDADYFAREWKNTRGEHIYGPR